MRAISGLCVHLMLVAPWVATSVPAQQVAGASETLHQHWVDKASVGLDSRAVDTLRRIRGADRQLLALRAYLHAGDSLAARWSWSEDQLTSYPTTPEGKAAAADIDAVVAAFAKANPGYDLQVNRQPRSLEVQLAHWNDNASVAVVSESLAEFLDRRLDRSASPSTVELRNALVQWTPTSAAALAAPGLSAHGQGRAFDFAVAHNGQVVAGLEAASAHRRWDEAGWTRKLHAAVATSGKPFVGPLQSPYEPWHYAYTPP
jgi:hypothetical protein